MAVRETADKLCRTWLRLLGFGQVAEVLPWSCVLREYWEPPHSLLAAIINPD